MRSPKHGRTVTILLLLTATVACGGKPAGSASSGSAAGAAGSVCALPPGDSAYAVAARQYVTGILPTPRRFLTAYGTDSALPPAVFAGIQGKGPTYMYAGDSSARTKLLQKLDSVGPWPTLLVTWRGMEQPDSTTAIIRMGGHYLGGEFHGKPAPKRAMRFVYDTAGWSFARTDEEGTT